MRRRARNVERALQHLLLLVRVRLVLHCVLLLELVLELPVAPRAPLLRPVLEPGQPPLLPLLLLLVPARVGRARDAARAEVNSTTSV